MGCGASSSIAADGRDGNDKPRDGAGDPTHQTATVSGRGPGNEQPSSVTFPQEARSPTTRGPTDNSAGSLHANGGGGSAAHNSSSHQQFGSTLHTVSAFTTYTITDSRGLKVVTALQNKNKVETMCKWLDTVLRCRDESGGKFVYPPGAPPPASHTSANPPNDSRVETSSVSSRNTMLRSVAGVGAEYGSVASQGFLGVSVAGASSTGGMLLHDSRDDDGGAVTIEVELEDPQANRLQQKQQQPQIASPFLEGLV